ncbi:tetratricopeptide repeat protein [Nocardioides sp. LMS-CY]|uniref:tetratricopeptide repeat protein n=1 Tax=Nocardioides sp. (strain LMS-CY) TaxID=2840457 RepID=UPI001BFFFC8A|nr:tetratricopeptide repeat protein [Nocardioides sp. LMS-CY]QWF21416.1 tetratricopeptide repeat protein [Nocardioides sp. LMS-CY]
MSWSPRIAAASVTLALLAALAGCGGDDESTSDADARTATADSASATLVQKGLAELAAGDTKAAKVTFENVVDIDPGNVYGHYNLGVIAQEAGDEKAAMKEYDAALATDGDFASALYNKAILTESADLAAAVELYQKTVEVDPTMAAAFMRLGFALVELGRTDAGEEALGKGIALDPSMKDVQAPTYD